MYSITPAASIPLYSNVVRYNCSHIKHVHPIFCVQLIIVMGLLKLDSIASMPSLECAYIV